MKDLWFNVVVFSVIASLLVIVFVRMKKHLIHLASRFHEYIGSKLSYYLYLRVVVCWVIVGCLVILLFKDPPIHLESRFFEYIYSKFNYFFLEFLMNRVVIGWMIGALGILCVILREHPFHLDTRFYLYIYSKALDYFYPYIHIKFPEFTGSRIMKSESSYEYKAIEEYLRSTCTMKPKMFEAEFNDVQGNFDLKMQAGQEITDTFQGFVFWWTLHSYADKSKSISTFPKSDRKRYFDLVFHRDHRDLVCNVYLEHILKTSKTTKINSRARRIYTNVAERGGTCKWEDAVFEHPVTFDTIAMDPNKKKEIKDDLDRFSRSEKLYSEIGKVWRRGYLLYGPPGTGKSSLVAAMANQLKYSVYDLELTSVKNNTMLRSLLLMTKEKSIIVIEDVDCSLDLAGKRKTKKKKKDEEIDELLEKYEEEEKESTVTLSGLLNFIDGLWSACCRERLIVFTTNHLNKIDPALIRPGRMDMHIELSYCSFEAFKIFANNYLHIKEHKLFSEIESLMTEVKITPADVAEKLLHQGQTRDKYLDAELQTEDENTKCLEDLIQALLYKKANPIIEGEKTKNEDELKE